MISGTRHLFDDSGTFSIPTIYSQRLHPHFRSYSACLLPVNEIADTSSKIQLRDPFSVLSGLAGDTNASTGATRSSYGVAGFPNLVCIGTRYRHHEWVLLCIRCVVAHTAFPVCDGLWPPLTSAESTLQILIREKLLPFPRGPVLSLYLCPRSSFFQKTHSNAIRSPVLSKET